MESILTTALNKHIPIQKIKIQRHKHKQAQWITFDILRSIKFRDNMYKKFKLTAPNTIQSVNIKQNLVTYNRILKEQFVKLNIIIINLNLIDTDAIQKKLGN